MEEQKNTLTVEEIKEEMKWFRDAWGSPLRKLNEVDNCTTKQELNDIINDHNSFLEDMLSDCQSNLEHFRQNIGVSKYV